MVGDPEVGGHERQAAFVLNPVTVSVARASMAGSETPWWSRRGVYGASSRAASSPVRVIESAAIASSMCLVLKQRCGGRDAQAVCSPPPRIVNSFSPAPWRRNAAAS